MGLDKDKQLIIKNITDSDKKQCLISINSFGLGLLNIFGLDMTNFELKNIDLT